MAGGAPSSLPTSHRDETKLSFVFGSFQIQEPQHHPTIFKPETQTHVPTNCKQSYADIVKGLATTNPEGRPYNDFSKTESISTGICNGRLTLKPTSTYRGKPAVTFSISDKQSFIQGMKYVLIAKFSHGRPDLTSIKDFFSSFNLKALCNISIYDAKHLILEFEAFEDYVKIWMNKQCMVRGFLMRFFKWKEDFHPSVEPSICPIWVHLPGLPLYLYQEETLMSIANAIGKPLALDSDNLNRSKLGCASFCVEVDISIEVIDKIWIEFEVKGTSVGREGLWQKVIFDRLPPYCSGCAHLGHTVDRCLRLAELQNKVMGTGFVEGEGMIEGDQNKGDPGVTDMQTPANIQSIVSVGGSSDNEVQRESKGLQVLQELQVEEGEITEFGAKLNLKENPLFAAGTSATGYGEHEVGESDAAGDGEHVVGESEAGGSVAGDQDAETIQEMCATALESSTTADASMMVTEEGQEHGLQEHSDGLGKGMKQLNGMLLNHVVQGVKASTLALEDQALNSISTKDKVQDLRKQQTMLANPFVDEANSVDGAIQVHPCGIGDTAAETTAETAGNHGLFRDIAGVHGSQVVQDMLRVSNGSQIAGEADNLNDAAAGVPSACKPAVLEQAAATSVEQPILMEHHRFELILEGLLQNGESQPALGNRNIPAAREQVAREAESSKEPCNKNKESPYTVAELTKAGGHSWAVLVENDEDVQGDLEEGSADVNQVAEQVVLVTLDGSAPSSAAVLVEGLLPSESIQIVDQVGAAGSVLEADIGGKLGVLSPEAETKVKRKCRISHTSSISPRKLSSTAAEFKPKWDVLVTELVEEKKQSHPVMFERSHKQSKATARGPDCAKVEARQCNDKKQAVLVEKKGQEQGVGHTWGFMVEKEDQETKDKREQQLVRDLNAIRPIRSYSMEEDLQFNMRNQKMAQEVMAFRELYGSQLKGQGLGDIASLPAVLVEEEEQETEEFTADALTLLQERLNRLRGDNTDKNPGILSDGMGDIHPPFKIKSAPNSPKGRNSSYDSSTYLLSRGLF